MKSHSKKALIAAIVSIAIVLVSFWALIQTNTATINYWVKGSTTLSKGTADSVTIYCNNTGNRNVGFTLTLELQNLTTGAGAPELKTIEIWNLTFALDKKDSAQKTVYFSTNDIDNAFVLDLSFNNMPFWDMVRGNWVFPSSLAYTWDPTTECFAQITPSPTFL